MLINTNPQNFISGQKNTMSDNNLEILSDLITDAHTRIQKNFKTINPVVGVSRGMRSVGIPADAMTIDCLKTGKRIIIILNDQQPEILQYQFSYKDQDPSEEFMTLAFEKLSEQVLYDWIKDYFSDVTTH
jgi:hypothetical protein